MTPAITVLRTAIEQAEKQEPVAHSLKDAVFAVLEGFTLPHDVRKILEAAYYTTPPAAPAQNSDHEFKNFHRVLCERFGYTHDEVDWKRDQVSLIEWIAKQVNPAAPVQEPVAWWVPKHKAPDMVSKVRWSDECEPLYTHPAPAAQPSYTREDLDRAFSAGLVEGEKLAIEPPAAQLEECVVCGDKVRVIPRPWVGLTDEEYEKAIRDNMLLQMNFVGIRDDIEAKLREKNGGAA
jgi:hypothetical protein